MKTAPSPRRRLVLAVLAIAGASVLLHAQLASDLVVRGDECLYRSRPLAALSFYRRALWFDSGNGVAADRFLFVAMTLRNLQELRSGIELASRYLTLDPADDAVRMDRAMAYRVTGQPERAMLDFAIVGRRTRDARALAFAGFAAESIGRSRLARGFWRTALAFAPRFAVAKRALDGRNLRDE